MKTQYRIRGINHELFGKSFNWLFDHEGEAKRRFQLAIGEKMQDGTEKFSGLVLLKETIEPIQFQSL